MSDKMKPSQADSSHDKSSTSELKSLGSTSSITIPKSSPLKKIIGLSALALALGAGGYFASTSEMGRNLLGSSAADSEDLAKEEGDDAALVPNHEGLPPDSTAEELNNAALPPAGPNPRAATAVVPVPPPATEVVPMPEPVKVVEPAAVESKAAVSKASKAKKAKAIVKKSKSKKKIVEKAKVKNKKSKAVTKKAKAKKAAAPAQASVAPKH